MKKIFKYIFAGMAAMSVVACSEDALETSPSSSVSGNELLGTATNALVSLNGVYRAMYTAGVSNSSNTHQCFGITAYNLVADVMGEDCIMNGQGSGRFKRYERHLSRFCGYACCSGGTSCYDSGA